EKLLRIVDNARSTRSITIVDGVIFKGEPEKRAGKKLDALPVDPTARDAEVNYRLMDGVVSLFETHALEVKMNESDKETLQRSLEEGRGKKNKGGMGGIIGLIAAKILFGKLFIVKLIALKALATAKIALVLAGILFAAWCLKQDHTKTTYEVVPHAHHHESHHPVHVEHVSHEAHGHDGGYSYGSDWNKNVDDAQNLAYSGYSRK
ncbi:Osiris 9, partial [Operophtera brumata]